MIFGIFSVKLIFKRPKKVGRCWQVGSDKERPKGRVGSGSDNARGSPILNYIAGICLGPNELFMKKVAYSR